VALEVLRTAKHLGHLVTNRGTSSLRKSTPRRVVLTRESGLARGELALAFQRKDVSVSAMTEFLAALQSLPGGSLLVRCLSFGEAVWCFAALSVYISVPSRVLWALVFGGRMHEISSSPDRFDTHGTGRAR
jgi:hypothetical protein